LKKWREEVHARIKALLWKIYKATGILMSSPDSSKDLQKLFKNLKLEAKSFTETGAISFTSANLRSYRHPVVDMVLEAGELADLASKYLDKYYETARADGWIRFNLHQLRSGEDAYDKKGTVSGRFSAAGDKQGGYNPQQVVSVDKQIDPKLEHRWCPDYVVRRLFVPGSPDESRANPGRRWIASDARQIEYRLFAHYARVQEILDVFAANPLADYHQVVSDLLTPHNPFLNRKKVKNVNFAKIYGAGLTKFAFMVGQITEAEYKAIIAEFDGKAKRTDLITHRKYGEAMRRADGINQTYDIMFPSVRELLRSASKTAETRGYVFTLLGRRARLSNKFHSALNRIIQGGAADVNKRVLLEVYKHREALGLTMRLTVHDELDGDLEDAAMLPRLEEILNTQYYDLAVPILWETEIGPTWAHCKGYKEAA
jgi:DNA polymerase I-like protein with 3'-5' exonuclease and polymerase domains